MSHKRIDADNDFAMLVSRCLEEHGIKVWIELRDIPDGNEWDHEVLENGLKKAHSVIVIATPEAMQSEEIANEWNYAIKNRLLIIVVKLRDCELAYRLDRRSYVDATRDGD